MIPPIGAAFPFIRLPLIGALEGARNDNWLAEDDGGRRYVLRRNLQHADVQRIQFQLRFQRHLLQHGFPTAQIIETRSGDLFVLDDAGVPWTLFSYVEGHEYDFRRPEQAAEAARRLAQFHAVAESFPDEAPVLAYQVPVHDWWADAEENLRDLEHIYRGVTVEEELSYLHDWWQFVLAEWPLHRLDALPVGWTYGDYHGRNMVFARDTLAGLLDFDNVERGPLVVDVASGAHMFGREARGSLRIRPEVAGLFVEEYSRCRTLTPEERAALPMMVAMTFSPNARYYRYCRDQRGEDLEPRLRRAVATMRALREEMARIGPMLTTG